MLARADDFLANASNDDECAIRIVRSTARWGSVFGLAAVTAMVLPLVGGMFIVTSEALSKPDTVNLALSRPLATIQILAGILMLSALVLVPARRLIAGMGSGGSVEIDGRMVRVAERGFFSSRTFHEPLDAYRGIAHRVRTTLSGIHHELVLVHPDARRDVVIALDRLEPTVTPASMIARIGLPEIAAGGIARRR